MTAASQQTRRNRVQLLGAVACLTASLLLTGCSTSGLHRRAERQDVRQDHIEEAVDDNIDRRQDRRQDRLERRLDR